MHFQTFEYFKASPGACQTFLRKKVPPKFRGIYIIIHHEAKSEHIPSWPNSIAQHYVHSLRCMLLIHS